jgi:hypothetical protein
MSIQSCPEGSLLVDNLTEAMRRQCELPAETHSPYDISLEMDTAEAVQSAYRHAADHLVDCPYCRTERYREVDPSSPKQPKNRMSSLGNAKTRSRRDFSRCVFAPIHQVSC